MPQDVFAKPETRIEPEKVPAKFYAQHLKPYEFLKGYAAGKKVLEVGCGDGYGASYLTEVANEVVGIDYAKEVILRAQDKYKADNLNFICMDAACLQFADNSFDIVCSFQVIEHIPEDKLLQYLSEIRRVLEKEGEFYLSTLNLGHAMKSALSYKKNPAHCKEFSLTQLKALLSQVFPDIKFYGLHLTLRHRFMQWIKKAGIFNCLPDRLNPVKVFYAKVTTEDFKIAPCNLTRASDFICVCRKQ